MFSMEDQIRDIAIEQHYNVIDKNMSIGCGEPFKREMAALLDLYKGELLKHFELTHRLVIKTKRAILEELVTDVTTIAEKYNNDKAISKLKMKLKGLGI